ncbi:MAG: phytoene desaturase [Bacteroidetes bacterium]|nr:phytoene desaturase [Bacteroidota bacterium]MBK9799139.1 phytoene desaturase [Bacteroidota bacterium]MBP6412379.1 phytoene desaturase [Bacteroidia bacterium]
MSHKIVVIGSGFSSLSAASYLAKSGFDVTVIEKNESAGGRARKFETQGYNFDMGPSWYWMPEIFDEFFSDFGSTADSHYKLKRLSPSYAAYFGNGEELIVPSDFSDLCQLFESIEPGAGKLLKKYLKEAEYKYHVAVDKIMRRPGKSMTELMEISFIPALFRLDLFQSIEKHIRKYFSSEKIIRLLEFPILFLGTMPKNTPALYSLMNYADMVLGTWYPVGGMYKIVEGMKNVALQQGVQFVFNETVNSINVLNGKAISVSTQSKVYEADWVVAGSDYQHTEQTLLKKEFRKYSSNYWNKRVMAPSALLFYLGIKKLLPKFQHHTLFFDCSLENHATEIYDDPQWPKQPMFYVCRTSASDASVAPPGCENLFILIPIASGLNDDDVVREKYYSSIMTRMEAYYGESIAPFVEFKRSYAHSNFNADYNAFKGNAYGLANTLKQTARFKPSITSNKVSNLFYTGQLTVPGPGVPPAIISGKLVAEQVAKKIKK